jgi:hypothetical protein
LYVEVLKASLKLEEEQDSGEVIGEHVVQGVVVNN